MAKRVRPRVKRFVAKPRLDQRLFNQRFSPR